MKEVKQYTGGVKRDLAYDFSGKDTMYRNVNFVVSSKKNQEFGVLENMDGNKVLFSFPDIPNVYEVSLAEEAPYSISLVISGASTSISGNNLEEFIANLEAFLISYPRIKYLIDYPVIRFLDIDDTLTVNSGSNAIAKISIPKQTGLKLIGGKSVDNYIVLFTTNNTDPNVVGAGQIWLCKYDSTNDTIQGLVGGKLDLDTHLIHISKMNLNTKNPIGNEIVLRNESDITLGCYFTDNFNEFRAINLFEKDLLLKNAEHLGVTQDFKVSQPFITGVSDSGTLEEGCSYQFFYRLLDTAGKYSVFSPGSAIIPIGSYDKNTPYAQTSGRGRSSGSLYNKAISISIEDIDTSYDVIEVIAVKYKSESNYTAYKFYEANIPSDGILSLTHTGSEDTTILPSDELTKLTEPFTVCKTITTRKGHLLVGNTKSKRFDIDFDARAYRFNSNRVCKIYKRGLTQVEAIIQGVAPSYPTDETLDALNPYNYEYEPGWTENGANAYKYRADGVTLGGDGPNVSYQFISTPIQLRSKAGALVDNSGIYNSQHANDVGDWSNFNGKTLKTSGFPFNFKNFIFTTYLTGYTAGEVYRFGIVFTDKKGNKSYVKWIGDIKFPERYEKDSYGNTLWLSDIDSSNTLVGRNIGIQFTVDISSIKTEIQGFEFVYVKRDLKNQTRLGSAPLILFGKSFINFPIPIGKFPPIDNSSNYYLIPGGFQSGGAISRRNFVFGGTLGYPANPLSSKSTDKIKHIQSCNIQGLGNYIPINNTTALNSYQWATEILYYGNPIANSSPYIGNRYNIKKGGLLSPLDSKLDSTGRYVNSIGEYPDSYHPGLGGYNYWFQLSSNISLQAGEAPIVSYIKKQKTQYGGSYYEARSKNKYKSTNWYIPVNSSSSNIITTDVYGGDTYIGELAHHLVSCNPTAEEGTNPVTQGAISVGVLCPVESSVNFAMPYGNPESATYYGNEYYKTRLNILGSGGAWDDLLRLQNLATRKLPPGVAKRTSLYPYFTKDFIDNNTEIHPHRVWVSQRKLDGELLDNWRNFNFNDYLEVDGNYGEINALRTINDTVVYLQRQGIGRLFVAEQTIINDNNNIGLVTGTGDILGGYQYLSTQYGTLHKFSVVEGAGGLHFIDALNKKWCVFNGQGVFALSDNMYFSSDIRKILTGAIIETEDPLSGIGIYAVRDLGRNRIYMTYLGSEGDIDLRDATLTGKQVKDPSSFDYTQVFNEELNSLETYCNLSGALYIDVNGNFIAINNTNPEVYLSNKGDKATFFGETYRSLVTLRLSPNSTYTKVFDAIEFKNEIYDPSSTLLQETFNYIQAENEYQNSGRVLLTLGGNIRRKMRGLYTIIPRDAQSSSPRMRGPYCDITLEYNNNGNKRCVLHPITVSYRLSQY